MSLDTDITTEGPATKGDSKSIEENNFIALINNTTDLMWSVDRNFNLITSNKPFDDAIRAAGKSIKKGCSVFAASLSPDQENRFRAYYERAFKGESFMSVEINAIPVKFCIEISFSPIWNKGEVIGVACHSRDVTERKKAEEEIINLHQERQTVLNRISDGVVSIDNNWRYTFINDAAMGNHPQTREKTIGKTLWEVHPEMENTVFWEKYHEAMATRQVVEVEDYYEPMNVWFSAKVYPSPDGLTIFYKDISERKRAEQKIVKSSRLYHFLSSFNKSIIHATNQIDLLNTVCSIAIETGNFKLAYIGMIDKNGILNITNFHGDKEGQHKIMKRSGIDYNNPVYKDTPTVKAISSGKLSFHNNMQNDPALAPWKEEFALLGIHSSISLPITNFGKVVGIFGIHSCIKNFFDLEEINLLEEAARDISFALENFEKERRHRETKELLLKNENRFRALIENSTDMITLTNVDGNFIYASPSITKIFGYEQEEFIHKATFDFFHPDDVPCLIAQRTEILSEPGKSFYFQYRILHKNGH